MTIFAYNDFDDIYINHYEKYKCQKCIGGDTMSKDKNEVVLSDTSDKTDKASKWVAVAGLVVTLAGTIIEFIKDSKD